MRAMDLVDGLERQADGVGQELEERRRRPEGADEIVHERGAGDALVVERRHGGEVLPLDVLDEPVVGVEARWRTLERFPGELAPLLDALPGFAVVDDRFANPFERAGLRMPDARAHGAVARLKA